MATKGFGLVMIGFAAGILLTAVVTYPPGNSGEWAAWVQAVGSVAAIIAAFVIGNRQTKEAIRRERQATTDELEAGLELFEYMAVPFQRLAEICSVRVAPGIDAEYSRAWGTFSLAQAPFLRLELHKVKSPIFLKAFCEATSLLDKNGSNVLSSAQQVLSDENKQLFLSSARRLIEIRDGLRAEIERLRAQ